MIDTQNLTQLGKHVEQPADPAQAVLETVPFTRGDGAPAIVRFTCPEFTSLCPVTGQPDSRTSSSTTRRTRCWSNRNR